MDKIDRELYIILGNRLSEARKHKGLSLSQAGDAVGKHKATIMRYEQGTSRIDMETLTALCRLYGITLSELPKPESRDFDDRLVRNYHRADRKTQSIVRQLLELEEEE